MGGREQPSIFAFLWSNLESNIWTASCTPSVIVNSISTINPAFNSSDESSNFSCSQCRFNVCTVCTFGILLASPCATFAFALISSASTSASTITLISSTSVEFIAAFASASTFVLFSPAPAFFLFAATSTTATFWRNSTQENATTKFVLKESSAPHCQISTIQFGIAVQASSPKES